MRQRETILHTHTHIQRVCVREKDRETNTHTHTHARTQSVRERDREGEIPGREEGAAISGAGAKSVDKDVCP